MLFGFFDSVNIYSRIKSILPKKLDGVTLPNGSGFIICIIVILWAAFMAYHNLRIKKMTELLEYAPELKKDKIFKIFYDLHKEGEFLKNANVDRRQKWDEDILIKIKECCTYAFRMNYLVSTGRRLDQMSLLQDEYYDKAVSEIKDYLENTFETYTKLYE